MFLGLHALLFDTRVLRHLVHNIHLRSDSLAAASWKALARIHLLVILPSAAYLHAVSPFPALQPLLAAFEARPPFPEYHGLLLPLACEAVAQLAGYAFLCAVVFLLAQHSACTRTTTSKNRTPFSDSLQRFCTRPLLYISMRMLKALITQELS